jgi:lipopolysaccharide assembly outer membrane protein LptD (OstA)
MKSKLHITLSQDGYISDEGTTPHDEVAEFIKTAPLTINDWAQIRKEVRNIVNEYLKQFPHVKRLRPTGDGTTVIILKSEYDDMKNTIAAQAVRIEEQDKIIAAQAVRIEEQDKIIAAQAVRIEVLEKENIELRRENVELRKIVEMQSKQIEMLVHRIEFLEARN